MTNIRISVVKTFSPEDVFGHEMTSPTGNPVQACNYNGLKEGTEWIVENLKKPDNFCGWAWHDLYKDICTLSFGGDHPWSEDDIMYTACTDGMRPVCFKLERAKE
ncbi:MAG: TIGR04076 family protein [Candidatus Kariarchaeaceae archaeon]|jgi:uncharacterized repeat protein (TIGR04076 family)